MNRDRCPDCLHDWERHDFEDGCIVGWRYDFDGVATTTGCPCRLAHLDRSAGHK